jgi:hypothetical protein
MTQLGWIGVLVMCAAMAYGKQDPYYLAVASADGLLLARTGEVVRVTLTASVQGQGGMQRHDFEINGTPLSVILTNGIIVGMVRDGKDLGIQPPELELDGNKEWVALSKHYHEEALRLLSFTALLGLGDSSEARRISLVGETMAGCYSRVFCELSRKNRLLECNPNGTLSLVSESVTGRAGVGFSAAFNAEAGYLTRLGTTIQTFSSDFSPNGGLRRLLLADTETKEDLTLREWDEKGNLVTDRDLQKDPLPDPFENGIRISSETAR